MRTPAIVPLSLSEGKMLALPLADFVKRFTAALPPLIQFLVSPGLRRHPKWGRYLPFDVEAYGTNASLGHACRPDIVLTANGPRVVEMDFVAAGRGTTVTGLPLSADRRAYVQTFANWYASMGTTQVHYATGTITTCRKSADTFAQAMRELAGYDVISVNIDETPTPPGTLVDRLFYWCELKNPLSTRGVHFSTAEPWLDSKMVFALVHDPSMIRVLETMLGTENLAFLREVFPPTYTVEDGGSLVTDQSCWVMKSSRVEADYSWGSRSVVVGHQHPATVWQEALSGINPPNKTLGRHPILQRYVQSEDFAAIWSAGIADQVHVRRRRNPSGGLQAFPPADQIVTGRLGVSFLVSNRSSQVFTPPVGLLTLRQDPLAHITPDAMVLPFRII